MACECLAMGALPWLCHGCAVGGGLAVQEELAFPLNHAGASFVGQAVSALRGSWWCTGDRLCPAPSDPVPAARPGGILLPAQRHTSFYARAADERLCLWSLDTCAQILFLVQLCGWVV